MLPFYKKAPDKPSIMKPKINIQLPLILSLQALEEHKAELL